MNGTGQNHCASPLEIILLSVEGAIFCQKKHVVSDTISPLSGKNWVGIPPTLSCYINNFMASFLANHRCNSICTIKITRKQRIKKIIPKFSFQFPIIFIYDLTRNRTAGYGTVQSQFNVIPVHGNAWGPSVPAWAGTFLQATHYVTDTLRH